MGDFDWKEILGFLEPDLEEAINLDEGTIKTEHKFDLILSNIEHILGYLDEELIPTKAKHLHTLNGNIAKEIEKLRLDIERFEIGEIKFVKEEKKILRELKSASKHHIWKLVNEEKKIVRIEVKHLKHILSSLKRILRHIEKSNISKVINEDITSPKQKERFKKLEEYYFLKIHKIIRAYVNVFKHLIDKEIKLARKLKKK